MRSFRGNVAGGRMQHGAEIATYLFEHARDIILVIDAESGVILDANRAAERAYRLSREQLVSRTVFTLRPDGSPPVTEQMRVAAEAGILFETTHRRGDGTEFPVEVSSRGEVLDGRPCLFSIIRDITERKRLELERDQLLAATQHALALREEFLMIASHELRAPVTGVSLQLQQLDRLIRRGSPREQIQLAGERALRESARLTTLMDTVLDAQAARGALAIEPTDVDLAEVVAEVVERLRVRAEQAGSQLEVDVPSITGRWDRVRLDQVITNLVLNALKYGAAKPVTIRASADANECRLSVSDHGIGVLAEDADRIFGKFERAVHTNYGGLGLGLFITRQIVEAHRGTISVVSTPGLGTTFEVRLPRTSPPQA